MNRTLFAALAASAVLSGNGCARRAPRVDPALAPIAPPPTVVGADGPRSPAARIDLDAAAREGRLLAAQPPSPRHARTGEMPTGVPLRWRGEGARLDRRGVASHPRARLVVDARDANGGVTEFLVDTGSSASALAVSAPAARAARVFPETDTTSMKATSVWHATLPRLDLGGLAGTDLHVLLHEREASRVAGGNLMGMTLLSGLALEHETSGGAWRLVPGGTRMRQGPTVRMAAPGLPVVAMVDDRGERAWALIDTGTWVTLVEPGTPAGRWRLPASDGSTVLSTVPNATAPWTNLRCGPHRITVWLGLDVLEGRTWTMDFETGIWSFAPAR